MIGRELIWRSPILLTPFMPDGKIDTQGLGEFVRSRYRDAGFAPGEIDSGAVILTGEAIKRKNARAIDELFAEEARLSAFQLLFLSAPTGDADHRQRFYGIS